LLRHETVAGAWRVHLGVLIGDDWLVAAGVVIAIGVTALVATTKVAAWWILPVAVHCCSR